MNILYTEKFFRLFKKLPEDIQKKAAHRELLFKKDPFAKSLKTHKLSGRFTGYYAFSVDFRHRIVFRILGKGIFVFLLIGDHSVYD